MECIEKKTYVCNRWRMFNYLKEHGFNEFQKVNDIYNEKFYVWLFTNSVDLQKCISDYYHRKEYLERN